MATDARERFLALLHGDEPDRVPVVAADNLRTGPQGGWVRRLLKRGLGLYPIARPYEPSFSFPGFSLPAFEDVSYTQLHYTEKAAQLTRHTIVTPVGQVTSLTRRNPLNLSVESTIVERFVKKPEDWRVFSFVFRRFADALRPTYEQIELEEDSIGGTGLTAAVTERTPFQRAWIELAALDRVFLDGRDRPGEFVEFVEGQRMLHERAAEIIAGCPAKLVLTIDNITNVISPRYYREFCIPYYEIYSRALQGTGKALGVHMDGRLSHLIAEIASSPFDVIDSLTVPPSGDVTIGEAKAAWTGKVIVVNCPPHLAWAEPAEVRDAYGAMLDDSGDRRFAVAHIEDLPLERVEPHLAAALDVFGYPG